MTVYVCPCGYEYDPQENDQVPFTDLPEEWVCPVCGLTKDMFTEK